MADNPSLSKKIAQGLTSGINSAIYAPYNAWTGMTDALSAPNPFDTGALRATYYLNEKDRDAARMIEQQKQNQAIQQRIAQLDQSPMMTSANPNDQLMSSMQSAPSFEQYLASMPEENAVPAQPATQPQLNVMSKSSEQQESAPSLAAVPQMQLQEPEYIQAYKEMADAQKEAIRQAEERLKGAVSRPQQFDLSPLLALAQSWTGEAAPLAAAYKRPTDRAKEVEALQEAVLKARGGASNIALQRAKDIENYLMQQKQMTSTEELKRAQIAALKENREGKKDLQEEKFQADIEKEYEKQYGTGLQNLGTFAEKVNSLKSLLKRSNGLPTGGKERKEYETLVGKIAVQYNQDLAKLGALAGADLDLIKKGIGQDTDLLSGWINSQIKGGTAASIAALDNLLSDSDKVVEAVSGKIGSSSVADRLKNRFKTDLNFYEKYRNKQPVKQKDYSGEELMQIRAQDPARFKQIQNELLKK
jgi:hypothetical protein